MLYVIIYILDKSYQPKIFQMERPLVNILQNVEVEVKH